MRDTRALPIITNTTSDTMRVFGTSSTYDTISHVLHHDNARRKSRSTSSKTIDAAVYAYIRAMRALGHTQVNSLAVARALSLPVTDVDVAIRTLSDKGVRVIG